MKYTHIWIIESRDKAPTRETHASMRRWGPYDWQIHRTRAEAIKAKRRHEAGDATLGDYVREQYRVVRFVRHEP